MEEPAVVVVVVYSASSSDNTKNQIAIACVAAAVSFVRCRSKQSLLVSESDSFLKNQQRSRIPLVFVAISIVT